MHSFARTVASALLLALPAVCPSPAEATPGARLRTHVEGSLEASATRRWVGPNVPAYVPRTLGTLELFLLDEVPEGHFALYRDPYGAGSCSVSASEARNCAYRLRLYTREGSLAFDLDPGPLLSRRDHLEIADVHYAEGVVYLNEACQSYAREARGRCSALVAVDPLAPRVLWRTRPLISRDVFLLVGDYIVAGYGFTAERDAVSLVRRRDGAVVSRIPVRAAPDDIRLEEDGTIRVLCSDPGSDATYRLRIEERKRGRARLEVVEAPPAPPRPVARGRAPRP